VRAPPSHAPTCRVCRGRGRSKEAGEVRLAARVPTAANHSVERANAPTDVLPMAPLTPSLTRLRTQYAPQRGRSRCVRHAWPLSALRGDLATMLGLEDTAVDSCAATEARADAIRRRTMHVLTELGSFLKEKVTNYSRRAQTPRYGLPSARMRRSGASGALSTLARL